MSKSIKKKKFNSAKNFSNKLTDIIRFLLCNFITIFYKKKINKHITKVSNQVFQI